MFLNSNLQKPEVYLRPAQPGRITKRLCGGLQIRIRGFKSLSALLLFLLFFTLIMVSCSANPVINEIMYDPTENDNYNEWIELYNPTNQSINITGWTITDNAATDTIEPDQDHGNGTTIIQPKGYAILTDHGTKIYENYSIPYNTILLYIDDKSIGNGLGNTGDKLVLKNKNNETIDVVEWIQDDCNITGMPAYGVKEGCTLSRYNNTDNNDSKIDFIEGTPTPGYKNKINPSVYNVQIKSREKKYLIPRDETSTIPLIVENKATINDKIILVIKQKTYGWKASLTNEVIQMEPLTSEETFVKIIPFVDYKNPYGNITILATSKNNPMVKDEITISFEILGPDLTIRKIKIYNENKQESNNVGEGEIIRIKAFLKNQGQETAYNVKASFYFNFIDKEHLLGVKTYENVSKYQKYPSILWDTQGVTPGNHSIFVIVDIERQIEETNEYNNILALDFDILETYPNRTSSQVLISELYYHSRPGVYNEYIGIFNPSMEDVNLSGWYITNEPCKMKTEQKRIIFPGNTIIQAKEALILSENAEKHHWETGDHADFEYNVDSNNSISQMNSSGKFIMSNNGMLIALKDGYNHTIDLVAYGNTSFTDDDWNGSTIPSSGKGVVLRRKTLNDIPCDSNTLLDWDSNRKFRIGQSDFSFDKTTVSGMLRVFVSPDNSYNVIVDEIRNAKNSIYLNMYEFTNLLLCDEIIKALTRGVNVKIFMEGSPVGGVSLEEKYVLKRISNYGGVIRFIINDEEKRIHKRYSFNHGKYLVIDNETVIVESCNWADTGVPKNPCFGNREWGVVIKNMSVACCFLDVFFDDYDPSRCDSVSYDKMGFKVPSDFSMDEKNGYGLYTPIFDPLVFNESYSVLPVFSPDTSYDGIIDLLDSAERCIYVEQLYVYRDWADGLNPFVERLIEKAEQGVDVRVILNYNPFFDSTNSRCNQTKDYLEDHGVLVKFIFSNWSVFSNVHNKGVVVDNRSVLVSSINWNENSVVCNREAGVIIENEKVAGFFADVFLYDWNLKEPNNEKPEDEPPVLEENENTIYIVVLFTMTFMVIARDWRKRKWT